MGRTGVVGRDDEFFSFLGIRDLVGESLVESFDDFYGCGDVRFREFDAVHGQSVGPGSGRHDLHYSPCTGPGHSLGVEVALGEPLSGEQPPVPVDVGGVFPEDFVVGRDFSAGEREVVVVVVGFRQFEVAFEQARVAVA